MRVLDGCWPSAGADNVVRHSARVRRRTPELNLHLARLMPGFIGPDTAVTARAPSKRARATTACEIPKRLS
jgi:hypothetical protein